MGVNNIGCCNLILCFYDRFVLRRKCNKYAVRDTKLRDNAFARHFMQYDLQLFGFDVLIGFQRSLSEA